MRRVRACPDIRKTRTHWQSVELSARSRALRAALRLVVPYPAMATDQQNSCPSHAAGDVRARSARGLLLAASLIALFGLVAVQARDLGAIAPGPEPANSPVKSLAATCAGCHGTDGIGAQDSAIPPIVGLSPAAFVERMRAFRDGAGNPTIMRQISAGYSEDQIQALAEYFAGIARR